MFSILTIDLAMEYMNRQNELDEYIENFPNSIYFIFKDNEFMGGAESFEEACKTAQKFL